jgi:hypothetical protein
MPKLARGLVLTASVFPFATLPLWAQGPPAVPTPIAYEVERPRPGPQILQIRPLPRLANARDYRSSHWKEGLATGAALGGAIGGLGMYAFCDGMRDNPDESCGFNALMGGAMGALVGGGVGALIGGLFPKSVSEDDVAP